MGRASRIAATRHTNPREDSPRHRPAALHSFYERRRARARARPGVPARRRGQRQGLDLDGEAARVDQNKAAIGRRRVAAGARGPELARLARPTIIEGAATGGRHPRHGSAARYCGWSPLAAAALASPAFETKAIKKAFNAYSDNVYYEKGDSDRANPTSPAVHHQARSRRYNTNRNDALDQAELLRDELYYLKKNPAETPRTSSPRSAW